MYKFVLHGAEQGLFNSLNFMEVNMKKLMLMLLLSGMIVQGNFLLSNNDDELGEDIPGNVEDVVEEAAAAPAGEHGVATPLDLLQADIADLNAEIMAAIEANGQEDSPETRAQFFQQHPDVEIALLTLIVAVLAQQEHQ